MHDAKVKMEVSSKPQFGHVKPHVLINHDGCRHTLGVKTGGTGTGMSLGIAPDPGNSFVMYPFPGAIIAPVKKQAIDQQEDQALTERLARANTSEALQASVTIANSLPLQRPTSNRGQGIRLGAG